MNNVIGGTFEDMVEQGSRSAARNMKQQANSFTKAAVGQFTGNKASQNDQGTNEQGNVQAQKMSDDQAKQFLKDLYGKSDKSLAQQKSSTPSPNPVQNALGIPQKSDDKSHPVSEALGIPQIDPNAGKTPEELTKLQSLRSQLHGDYYQNLVNPPKSKEEPVVEKLEREKQQEEFDLAQKQKEKPDPLAIVKTGTGEKVVGVSG